MQIMYMLPDTKQISFPGIYIFGFEKSLFLRLSEYKFINNYIFPIGSDMFR